MKGEFFMKKIFKVLFAFTMLVVTGLFVNKLAFSSAAEIPTDRNNTETSQLYYEVEDTANDPENQITNIPMNALPDILTNNLFNRSNPLNATSIAQGAFEYHFENYVKLAVNFIGGTSNKITLTFDTYSWSNSQYFNVEMYTLGGSLRASKPIWKSYGNSASVYFYLPAGDDYYFRFSNSNYGQKIDGVGYWTLEY